MLRTTPIFPVEEQIELMKRTLPLFCTILVVFLSYSVGASAQQQVKAVPIQAQEEAFQFANMLYGNGNFEQAESTYIEFLKAHPKSPNAPTAWYRLGDCQRRMDKIADAKRAFQNVLTIDPGGPFAGFAAYAMAVYTFNEDKYDAALPYFRIATSKLNDPRIQVESQFFYAQALQLAGSNNEAIKEYEAVLQAKIPNGFQERAELDLAKLLQATGRTDDAIRHFANLANIAKDPSIKDESTFKAGILGLSSEDPKPAEALLLKTLKSPGSPPEFKAQAQLALILRANEREDFQSVIVYYGVGPLGMDKTASTAQMMMIAAHAYRRLNKLGNAIEIYSKIENEPAFRKLDESKEAGFRKLQCFLEAGDENIARWVDKYVAAQSAIDAETPYIDLALLIKAERLYDNKAFKEAARAYRDVRPGNIDPKFVPIRHYKMGWSLIECGELAQGLDILGEFTANWPEDPRVPSALVRRAMTFQELEQFEKAQASYSELANQFPDDPNTEFALQQIALIHAQQRRIDQMVKAYQELLKRFPNTKVKAEAHYWIGGGLFDLKNYADCIPALDKARQLNPKDFEAKVTLRIVLSYYHLDQLELLESESKRFLAMNVGELQIPIQVFAFLGRQLFDQGEFLRARGFLERASNPAAPEKTPPDIWEKLYTIHLDQKKWKEAITAIDNYLIHQAHPAKRADAMLLKAAALIATKQIAEAKAVGEDILKLVRTGRPNAEARILLGDIATQEGDLQKAIGFYVIVAELGNDPITVPKALAKLVKALEAAGETIKAEDYQRQLSAKFPNYQP